MVEKTREQKREYALQYRKKNKKKIAEKAKIYREKNREKIRESHRKHVEDNRQHVYELNRKTYWNYRDKYLAARRAKRLINKEQCKKYAREYYCKNKKIIDRQNSISRRKPERWEKQKIHNRARCADYCRNLKDQYVNSLLRQKFKIKIIPPELTNMYRTHILLIRHLKKHNKKEVTYDN